MTRETRIGMLVGLMFIVLFGVVLSELGPTRRASGQQDDRIAGNNFYVNAPITPTRPQQSVVEQPLVARRRIRVQGPAAAPRSVQAPRRGLPQRIGRSTQAPVVAPQRVAPRRPAVTPTRRTVRTLRRTDSREMTIEELARSRGVTLPTVNSRTYVTRSGDNLTAIARKFYRSASHKAVMKIFNANRSVLRSPDSLGIGLKIVIPN